ncbi:MAG: hypothetical protein LCH32_08755 [Bacteroidetes bacterium]|nr:hypothetical protein [Bacteroidota bacterium]
MKTITKQLLIFAMFATVFTIIFRYFLSYGIENQSGITTTISAVTYGILMFVFGWYFGLKEIEFLPIYDIGFRFHLTTYLIHNVFSLLWIVLGFGSKFENINIPIKVAFYWGISLIIHFIYFILTRKNSINNINKEDIFE